MSESDLIADGWYLKRYRDVAAAGIPADAHFETYGWHEGRDPDALFDTKWYLAKNPDVAAAHIDPLLHFDTYGWHEGRDPGPSFDTSDYLARNPDVTAAGIDPLTHYLLYGQAEGRHIDPAGTVLKPPAATIIGTPGVDWLTGTDGNDRMFGAAGNDQLLGGEGNDELHGGTGNDALFNSGSARVYGGDGDDFLFGVPITGDLWGGPGFDHFSFGASYDQGAPQTTFGHNTIMDYREGEPLKFSWDTPSASSTTGFEYFDSNHNGHTDSNDTGISIVGGSTVINVKAVWAANTGTDAAYDSQFLTGDNLLIIEHVTRLIANDFVPTFEAN